MLGFRTFHPAVAAVFIGWLAGCATPDRQWQPQQDPDTLDATAFTHYLARVPVVTVDEGMRAVLLLTHDGARFPTYEHRYRRLIEEGAIREAWDLRKDQVLDKGTLAYMLRTIGDLPPGVNERLLRPTGLGDRRYALATCVYQGLLPHSVARDPVRGGELLSAITAAERYLQDRRPTNP